MLKSVLSLRAATCALGIFALSLPAAAQTSSSGSDRGLYVFGGLGLNMPLDSEVEGAGLDVDADLEDGWTASGGLGYAYGGGFRSELELSLRDNDVGSVGGVGASGEIESQALMFNVLYDFDLGGRLTPFIGAGVGGARVSADGVTPVSGSSVDDHDIGLAWQATAGLAYAVSRNMDLTLAYRYFEVPSVDYTTAAGSEIESDYATHEVMFGVRIAFGAPPPAPMPVAEPTPPEPEPAPPPQAEPAPPPVPREYLVFFDFDSARITPQASDILRTAVENATETGATRIRLVGHADRAGPTGYNQQLSVQRAEAVRAELEQLGIRDAEISVVGRGETEPLVPTEDGVREPRNRRVEIVLPQQ